MSEDGVGVGRRLGAAVELVVQGARVAVGRHAVRVGRVVAEERRERGLVGLAACVPMDVLVGEDAELKVAAADGAPAVLALGRHEAAELRQLALGERARRVRGVHLAGIVGGEQGGDVGGELRLRGDRVVLGLDRGTRVLDGGGVEELELVTPVQVAGLVCARRVPGELEELADGSVVLLERGVVVVGGLVVVHAHARLLGVAGGGLVAGVGVLCAVGVEGQRRVQHGLFDVLDALDASPARGSNLRR